MNQETPDDLSSFPLVYFHYTLEYTRLWPVCGPGFAVYAVRSSNDHELEIAKEVDKMAAHNELGPDAVPEILAFLDFKVSATDYEFLKRYMQWRIANPIMR